MKSRELSGGRASFSNQPERLELVPWPADSHYWLAVSDGPGASAARDAQRSVEIAFGLDVLNVTARRAGPELLRLSPP
ncbi:hypothetical protein [Streptomyces mayteni]